MDQAPHQPPNSTNFQQRQPSGSVRLRSEYLTLEYRSDKPLLKSIGKNTHHLEKMGVLRGGTYFLCIEEALYLTELGAAIVVRGHPQNYSRPLAIAELYALLGKYKISLFKYSVYAQLVRAGYIVRRAQVERKEPPREDNEEMMDYAVTVKTFRFPSELLDQFPHISDDCRSLIVPQNRRLTSDRSLLNESDLTIASVNSPLSTETQHSLLVNLRRDREPWVAYRPRWWPLFGDALRSAESWKVYEMRRKKAIERQQNRQKQQNWQRKGPANAQPSYDYDLRKPPTSSPPIYRLLVIDERFTPGEPSIREKTRIALECKSVPFLLASGDPASMKFTRFGVEKEEALRLDNL